MQYDVNGSSVTSVGNHITYKQTFLFKYTNMSAVIPTLTAFR